jgi:hypothetical protein
MSISASKGWLALSMWDSLGVGWKAGETQEGRTFQGAAFSKTWLIKACSALSSDRAQPIIVTAVTTESGALLGPSEDHGMGHTARGKGMSRYLARANVAGVTHVWLRGRASHRGPGHAQREAD